MDSFLCIILSLNLHSYQVARNLDPGNSQRCAVACWVTQVISIDVLSWGSMKRSLTVQLVEHVRVC